MLRPKPVGWLILVYVLLTKTWSALGLLGSLSGGIKGHDPASLMVLAGSVLEGLLVLCYVAGSIGLILLRRWGSIVVLLTATVEFVAILFGMLASFFMIMNGRVEAIGGMPVFTTLRDLIGLFFPGAIAYAVLRLRRHWDAWQVAPSLRAHRPRVGPSAEHVKQPAWLSRLFWTIIGTGLAWPSILGVIVREVLKAQGKPVVPLGKGVTCVIAGTFFFAAPFVALAFLGKSLLKRALSEDASQVSKKRFILVGACVGAGISLSVVWGMHDFFQGESIAVLIFAPFSPFYVGFIGAAAGALIAWTFFYLWQRIAGVRSL